MKNLLKWRRVALSESLVNSAFVQAVHKARHTSFPTCQITDGLLVIRLLHHAQESMQIIFLKELASALSINQIYEWQGA